MICIKNEPFPRISITRRVIKDGFKYFGPYPSVKIVRQIINLLIENFKIRNCSHDLTKCKLSQQELKNSVEYYIGNCKGCCQGEVSVDEYNERIKSVSRVLKGNVSGVIRELKQQMRTASEKFLFEEAQQFKLKISALEKHQAKSAVVSASISNVDVFSIVDDEHHGYINYIKVIEGAINQSRMIEVKKKLNEDKIELKRQLLMLFSNQSYQSKNRFAFEINIPTTLKGNS